MNEIKYTKYDNYNENIYNLELFIFEILNINKKYGNDIYINFIKMKNIDNSNKCYYYDCYLEYEFFRQFNK